jgi:glutathione S-transferase
VTTAVSPFHQVRSATARDIARVVDFVLAEARESEDRPLDRAATTQAVTAAIENPGLARYWVLADRQDALLGAIAATTEWSDWQNANYWWISFVYLAPEARGRGLLEALVREVEATAQAERAPEVRLYVHPGNARAIRAYEKLGFSDMTYRFMRKPLPRVEAASLEPAEGGEVVLWTSLRRCPWTLGVWAALREKGIPFQAKTLDPNAGEIRAGEYAQATWSGKAPALQHGDTWLVESLAILEYLEDVFAPPRHPRMLPADPRARGRDRQVLSWLRTDLFELRRCLPFQGIFVEVAAPAMTPEAHRQAEKLLAVVSARLEAGDARPTLADFELAFTVQRLIHYSYDLSGFPDVVAFAERIWNRPSVQSWVETKLRRVAGA